MIYYKLFFYKRKVVINITAGIDVEVWYSIAKSFFALVVVYYNIYINK